jgi:hypothetical protein
MNKIEKALLVLSLLTMGWGIYMISKENSESNFCEFNNGVYHGGFCFKSDALVRIK